MGGKGLVKSTIIGCALLAVLVFTVISGNRMFNRHPSLRPTHTSYANKNPFVTKFCQKRKCVMLNISKVREFYPNLLVSVKSKNCAFDRITISNCTTRSIAAFKVPVNSDFDKCCPTAYAFDNLPVRRNVYGVERVIVKSSEYEQLIPKGYCLGGGTCNKCYTTKRTMSILVVKFVNSTNVLPLEFDQFEIPMHCTCLG